MGTNVFGTGRNGPPWRIFRLPAWRVLLAAALWLHPGAGWADDTRFYKIEAAFLYNFFNYITWPGQPDPAALKEPAICLYGSDPVEPYLEYIQRKMAAERTIAIRTVQSPDGLPGCHLLFSRQAMPAAVMKAAHESDTLTVSDAAGHVGRGGMIELSREGGRIAIKIDHTLLETEGFRVSSRLLNLAQRVK